MRLKDRLDRGDAIIMDGDTGTEMEKHGVPMEEKGWSAGSTIAQPEILRQVHEDYIKADADIIISKTLATSRHVLDAWDLADNFHSINATAARLAVEARDNSAGRPVYFAGSIATSTFWTEPPPRPWPAQTSMSKPIFWPKAGLTFSCWR